MVEEENKYIALDLDGDDYGLLSTISFFSQASEHEQNVDEPIGVKNSEGNFVVDPYIGMKFSTHEEAYNFYNAYARLKGFSVRKGHTTWSRKKVAIISRIYVCDKEGFKFLKDKREDGRNVVRKFDTRCGRNVRMVIGLDRSTEKWVVRNLNINHNGHPLTTPNRVKKHYSHRTLHRAQSTRRLIDTLDNQGLRPSTICKVVDVAHGNEQGSLTQQECQAQLRIKRKNNVGHECVSIVRQFQEKNVTDPQFYFAFDLENDGTMRSVFWMDGMISTQRSEGINAFFDHFVNANTELHDFVKQYNKAAEARRAAELEQDFKSTNSKEHKDSYSMLHERLSKDGASATYAVWNIDREAGRKKTVKHHVVFDASKDKRIKCSCAKFEMEGILCKHSLHILVKKQVLEIPSRYIMQRWTIKARHVGCGVVRNCISNSENQLSIIKHWALRSRCNKALEDTLTSSTLYDKFSAFLDSFFEEVGAYKKEKELNDNGNESNASNKMPTSSIPISVEDATQITIRDPDKPIATKGRPAQTTRIKSGMEIAQEKGMKKQRFCGFCKGKGHYITSCPLAKVKNVAGGGRES
ncbi:protein FAR1-RELATED SEQUENCE 5-like [Asparagus officinalis]|uniref:protein FAR1-RELATED SEQUENCE 5-like n=1 Tax=Asparagus officinalis TaxID=4686 RepID=UPI00098E10E7|nr:protein FAR1-RELATED SEQUENCE 5-like [Asparagus officinalis]